MAGTHEKQDKRESIVVIMRSQFKYITARLRARGRGRRVAKGRTSGCIGAVGRAAFRSKPGYLTRPGMEMETELNEGLCSKVSKGARKIGERAMSRWSDEKGGAIFFFSFFLFFLFLHSLAQKNPM